MNIVDIIVIAILAVFAIIGFAKGFLNTVLSLFGNLAALGLAIVIVKPCAKFLDNIFHIVDWLGGLIIKGINGIMPAIAEGATLSSQEVINHFNGQGLIGKLVAMFVKKDSFYGLEASEGVLSLADTLKGNLGNFAATVFTVVVMFILIKIAIAILARIFDAITKKRALSGLDRLLGFALGALKGAILVTCILGVIYALSPILPSLNNLIQGAPFANWIYGYVHKLINWLINTIDFTAIATFAK